MKFILLQQWVQYLQYVKSSENVYLFLTILYGIAPTLG